MIHNFFISLFILCSLLSLEYVEARWSSNLRQQGRISNRICIPLRYCPEFLSMLQNKHNVPGMTFPEVLQHIQDHTCGFDGNDPKVKCNIMQEEELIEDPVNQTRVGDSYHRSNIEYRVGGVIDAPKVTPRS